MLYIAIHILNSLKSVNDLNNVNYISELNFVSGMRFTPCALYHGLLVLDKIKHTQTK